MIDKPPDEDPAAAELEAAGAELDGHGIFPMRVAVQLTGLTSDTIRAWERRHHAIEPVRSAGNTRKFTQDDIRRLLLLREATEAGHSIGNIADLDNDALRALRRVPVQADPSDAEYVEDNPHLDTSVAAPAVLRLDGYFDLLTRYDIAESAAWLRRVAALNEPRAFVLEVVAPALVEIRERRTDARLGGPHLIAAWQQFTAVLNVMLEATASARGRPELVTVGAARQRHAIAAMATTLLARDLGRDAAFVGTAMPDADIVWAVDALRAGTVVVDLSVPTSFEQGPATLSTFERMAARMRVLVIAPPGMAAAERSELELVTDLADVDRALRQSPGRRNGKGPQR